MGLSCFYDSIHYTNQTCSTYEFLFVVHFYNLLPQRPNSLATRHGFFSELAESLATHGGNLYRFFRPGCWKPSSSVARFKGTSTISWMTSSFANEVSECTVSVLPPWKHDIEGREQHSYSMMQLKFTGQLQFSKISFNISYFCYQCVTFEDITTLKTNMYFKRIFDRLKCKFDSDWSIVEFYSQIFLYNHS